MLYNIEKKKVMRPTDCILCSHYDKKQKKCNGIGKACFEYDELTKTVIDGVTKLPLRSE